MTADVSFVRAHTNKEQKQKKKIENIPSVLLSLHMIERNSESPLTVRTLG